MSEVLHRAQVSILRDLRYSLNARFNELKRPTSLESDAFKFHLRKLVSSGYVEKTVDGSYRLTPKGKEYANVLDEHKRAPKKQPKLAIMLLVTRQHNDETQYLLYQRKVNPFLNYWAAMSDAVLWGESFEAAASKRLKKHSGYEADFTLNSLVRTRNFTDNYDTPVEDILFAVMQTSDLRGQPHAEYAGGVPQWLSLSELLEKEFYFPTLPKIIENAHGAGKTLAIDTTYSASDF